jgi:hypothetical protein
MLADPETGCTCYDDFTRRCPVHCGDRLRSAAREQQERLNDTRAFLVLDSRSLSRVRPTAQTVNAFAHTFLAHGDRIEVTRLSFNGVPTVVCCECATYQDCTVLPEDPACTSFRPGASK